MTVDQLYLELKKMVGAGQYNQEAVVLTDESRREIREVVINPDGTIEIVAD